MDETNNFNFTIQKGEGNDVVFRQGDAAPVVIPKGIKVTGSPGSCLEFVKMKTPFPENTHILVNRREGIVTLVSNEHLPEMQQTVIKSKVELCEHLLEFKINQNHAWSPDQLGKLFKRRRRYFPEPNLGLVTALTNFKAKVDTQLEKVNDHTSRRFKEAVEKVIDSDLPPAFKLKMPIINGGPTEEFVVELILEARDNQVVVYLDSVPAEELAEEAKSNAVDKELEGIGGKYAVFEL